MSNRPVSVIISFYMFLNSAVNPNTHPILLLDVEHTLSNILENDRNTGRIEG